MKILNLLIVANVVFAFSPQSLKSSKSTHSTKSFNGVLFEKISQNQLENNWFNKSSSAGLQGISTDQFYDQFQFNGKDVIVAVIDSGVDVNHEDLDGKIWINQKEIPNNQIDDDKNGYVDDVMGWNFIGGKKGFSSFVKNKSKNKYKLINNLKDQVVNDSLEVTRELKRLLDKKKDLQKNDQPVSKSILDKIELYESEVLTQYQLSLDTYNYYTSEKKEFIEALEIIKEKLKLSKVTVAILEEINDKKLLNHKNKLLEYFDLYDNPLKSIQEAIDYYDSIANYKYNMSYDPRKSIIKDENLLKYYGNNNVIGPDSFHGTHVAGIIAATRNNNIGINGVATRVKIMPIRVVPNGDERDKDVANAIYYAVDNGAKIINMSFGKSLSPDKRWVYQAVQYAQDKNVLIVHAAGNENIDIDKGNNFPSATYRGTKATNWIEVGASNKLIENLMANFSNYGKNSVDLFAPGVDIISTAPNNEYTKASGTSMSTPVVSGVAAIIMSAYPKLNPNEVKDIIIMTGNRYPMNYVFNPAKRESVLFSSLSTSGTIPNIFEAMNFLKFNTPKTNYVIGFSDAI